MFNKINVFPLSGALMEYAVILLLLKKRRKPRRTIDEGVCAAQYTVVGIPQYFHNIAQIYPTVSILP
jgi:hypothetical protein